MKSSATFGKMLKAINLILLISSLNFRVFSQSITNYTFSASTSTYSNLTFATAPTLTGSTDEGYFNTIPIGFDFFYMGNHYTTVSASTNGWMALGTTISDAMYNNDLTTWGNPRPIIAPLWDDLDVVSSSNVSYKTTGSSPNRIFTLQWSSVKWDYNSSSPVISFQVKLYETTGVIKFTYKQGSQSTNSPSASIGITDGTAWWNDYLSLDGTGSSPSASNSTETNTLSSKPASNQVYTFTPPSAPSAPSGLTFSDIQGTSMTLNWTDNSSNETGFVIYRSTDNSTFSYYTQVAANATAASVTSLSASTTYYWKVYSLSEGVLSSAATGTQATCSGFTISQLPTSGLIGNYPLDGGANDVTNTNQGVLENGATPTTDRFGNSGKALSFSGNNRQFMGTTTSYNNPSDFTISTWFKTNTLSGGLLMGFGNYPTGICNHYDRHLYMTDAGQIYFGVNPSGLKTLNSANSYNDDTWHMVTATVSSSSGSKLYIDGSLIASDATATGGENYTGYWRIAGEYLGGWPSQPSSAYFNGSLDDVVIYSRAISSAEVTTLYNNANGASSNSPVCNGGTLNLTSPTVSGATYAWTGPNSFSSSSQNPSVSNMSTAKAGTYKVTITSGGCSSSAYVNAAINTSLSTSPGINQVPTSNLIAYYKFNGNALDVTGNDNGVLQNSPSATSDRFGNSNAAYSFNGSNQYIYTVNSYNNPSDLSISVWFKTTSTNGGKLVGFGNNRSGGSTQFDRHIYMDNYGRINFGVNPSSGRTTITSTLAYNDGLWHQAIATLSSTTGIALYIDGSLVASSSSALGGENYTGYWKIGYDEIGGTWPNNPNIFYFNGTLDDVILYSRAISSTEVSTLYASPDGAGSNSPVCDGGTLNLTGTTVGGATYAWSGPSSFSSTSQNPSVNSMSSSKTGTYSLTVTSGSCIATAYALASINKLLGPNLSQPSSGLQSRYPLDGNANDVMGVNNGIFQYSPTITTDRFGNSSAAYSFDGSSQYMTTSVANANLSNFTLSLWFKTTTNTGGQLIGRGSAQFGSSGSHDRHIYMDNSGLIYFGVWPGTIKTINSTSSYNDGNWHMVTASLSSTNGMKLYIDGSLVATDATTTSAENASGYWRIAYDNLSGWTNTPTSYYFNGSLDDIYTYTKELSASEVTTLYYSGTGAGSNAPVCSGASLSLNSTTISGASYSWSGPNSFSSATQNPTVTSTYTSSNSGVYTLVVTDGSGCKTTANTNVVSNTTSAGQWVGAFSTAWGTASNWCTASVPTSANDVSITSPATYMPLITGSANCKNLTLGSSASLTNTAGTLNIYGNFSNSGTYTDNGTTVFTGASAQSVTGATSFNNLTLNNANGLTLNNADTVNGILTLTSGTLASGGNLTVNLNSGSIAGTGSGSISGNLTVKKTPVSTSYHYLSTPLSGTTVAQLTDDIYIGPGVMYSYDETKVTSDSMAGWTDVGNYTTYPLASMTGYATYFYNSNVNIDITGTYSHSGTYSSTLTHTNVNGSDLNTGGWNLVGNPYPSPLDWTAASGWTKTGLDDAIYMWDGANQRYASYVSGTGANGGTQYIPSMQGFFVHVSNQGTGTLGMDNNVRVTSTNPGMWKLAAPENILHLKVEANNFSDETVIRFREDATNYFDTQLDAYKLYNSSESPDLCSKVNNEEYSINSLPLGNTSVPLKLKVGSDGKYTFTAEGVESFGSDIDLIFEDKLMNVSQDLKLNPTYSCQVSGGETSDRFFINCKRTSNNIIDNGNPSIVISGYQQTVNVRFLNMNTSIASIIIINTLGEEIYSSENVDISTGSFSVIVPSIQSGIYLVKVMTAGGIQSGKVFLNR